MIRVYNFCSGPAILPDDVLQTAALEMTNWRGVGYSVMGMSHRAEPFTTIYREAIDDLRDLLNIPDNYRVLFLASSASLQFSAIPLNLMRNSHSADYIVTGDWSKKAYLEALRYGDAQIAASTEGSDFQSLPDPLSLQLNPNAAYLYYCPNETIRGVEFDWIPDSGDVPLVADMSSTLLSKPIDVSRYGIILAGAQKNIGPAGMTVVIIRNDLLGEPLPETPKLLNYEILAETGGLYNTPPTYSIYIAGLVFKWIKTMGGLEAMEERNREKAKAFYRFLDSSRLYYSLVDPTVRSRMNIPFFLRKPELEEEFFVEAERAGLIYLRGHRSVGGARASFYNAMPVSGVYALIEFMAAFELDHTD